MAPDLAAAARALAIGPAMLTLRDYLYLAAILALLVGFGAYTIHERHAGAATVRAAEARAVEKANAQVAAATSNAVTSEAQNVLIYKQAVSVPAVGDLGVVCERAVGPIPLPAASAGAGAATRNDAPERGVGPAYDPSGAILTRARAADAEIAYLQRRVAELEKQMEAAP